MNKIMITENLRYYFSLSDLDMKTLKEIRDELSRIEQLYSSTHTNIRFDIDYYGGDGSTSFVLLGERLETDEEFAKRVRQKELDAENARKSKIASELKERELFERLKKKYEG